MFRRYLITLITITGIGIHLVISFFEIGYDDSIFAFLLTVIATVFSVIYWAVSELSSVIGIMIKPFSVSHVLTVIFSIVIAFLADQLVRKVSGNKITKAE